jgi:hypothetical protein
VILLKKYPDVKLGAKSPQAQKKAQPQGVAQDPPKEEGGGDKSWSAGTFAVRSLASGLCSHVLCDARKICAVHFCCPKSKRISGPELWSCLNIIMFSMYYK